MTVAAARRTAARAVAGAEDLLGAVRAELGGLRFAGPRARQATTAALSVAAAVTLALLARLDMPWWAAISAFVSVQATRPGSVQRAALRVAGTVAGAAAGLLIAPCMAFDHVAGTLLLFAVATLGMVGFLVSAQGYAWLFLAITADLVTLLSVGDPGAALHVAVDRSLEVALGCASAVAVVALLGSDAPAAAAAPCPGWSGLLDAQWPAVLHAVRTGITVALLPWAWGAFDLPGLPQMAATVAAVMATPVSSAHPVDNGRAVARRALHRAAGCLLGGAAALLALSASPGHFLPWLGLLAAGVWVCSHVQTGAHGVGYVGIQASVVWIIMIVQGWGPPDSILPGIDRLAGILAGLAILSVVSLLLWPDDAEAAPGTAPPGEGSLPD